MPGWVDIHTHYDGQVTWDPQVTPSSWHGVTTVVMGNCGVGFAPVRRDGHDFLIELMESVEDIPGTALHEGMDWQWESFPEYLDALDSKERVLDIAAQVPHAALRAYVMGERAHDDATDDEIAEMARLTQQALEAGAVGFSTSRTMLHRSKHGLIPGTRAPIDELMAIGDAVGDAGHGVFQLIDDGSPVGEVGEYMAEIARRSGATVTYSLAQSGQDPLAYRAALEGAAEAQAAGPERRAASGMSAHGDDVRAAVVAASVHHPPHVPTTQHAPPRRAGRRSSARRTRAQRCSPRSRRRAVPSPSS